MSELYGGGIVGITPEEIRNASIRISDSVKRTSCQESRTLSDILGANVFVKFESEQYTAAFKERGAVNKLLSLSASERQDGVVAMSAGNHAKAVAWHAQQLGIPATIVMPRFTPNVKVEDTRRFGARVVLDGNSVDDAGKRARAIAVEEGLHFVHPYDDPHVINGQGTIGLEMLEQVPDLDVLMVPVGGGGLISGIACIAKSIRPEIQVIGVQSSMYSAMWSRRFGEEKDASSKGMTIAEGIAVKIPGEIAIGCIQKWVDDIVLVEEEAIEEAIYLLLNIEKTVAEGAGAASLAAVKAYPDRFSGKRVGIVLSGANIDMRTLATIVMRNLARNGLIVQVQIASNDTPGALADIAAHIGRFGANILEVNHLRTFSKVGIRETLLNVMVEVRDCGDTVDLITGLRGAGYDVVQN